MWLRSIGLAVVLGVVAGCGTSREIDAGERAEIEARLAEYAMRLPCGGN